MSQPMPKVENLLFFIYHYLNSEQYFEMVMVKLIENGHGCSLDYA